MRAGGRVGIGQGGPWDYKPRKLGQCLPSAARNIQKSPRTSACCLSKRAVGH